MCGPPTHHREVVRVHEMHKSEGFIFRDIPAYPNKHSTEPHSESYDNSAGTRPVGHQTL